MYQIDAHTRHNLVAPHVWHEVCTASRQSRPGTNCVYKPKIESRSLWSPQTTPTHQTTRVQSPLREFHILEGRAHSSGHPSSWRPRLNPNAMHVQTVRLVEMSAKCKGEMTGENK